MIRSDSGTRAAWRLVPRGRSTRGSHPGTSRAAAPAELKASNHDDLEHLRTRGSSWDAAREFPRHAPDHPVRLTGDTLTTRPRRCDDDEPPLPHPAEEPTASDVAARLRGSTKGSLSPLISGRTNLRRAGFRQTAALPALPWTGDPGSGGIGITEEPRGHKRIEDDRAYEQHANQHIGDQGHQRTAARPVPVQVLRAPVDRSISGEGAYNARGAVASASGSSEE